MSKKDIYSAASDRARLHKRLRSQIIENVLKIEGGYTDDSLDSGGQTNFGITIKTAREYGYKGLMSQLTKEEAIDIYITKYWNKMNLDKIIRHSVYISSKLFDMCVNLGVKRAAIYFQRALNVLNNREALYDDIKVDGNIGSNTVAALSNFHFKRHDKGLFVLESLLDCLQGSFYISLAERREKDERFIFGWFNHRILNKNYHYFV